MAVYDINGNNIASGGEANTDIFDKVYNVSTIVNLLDRSKSTVGRMQSPPAINTYITGTEVSDFIYVYANNSYVCQVCDTSGALGIDGIYFYDDNKSYLRKEDVAYFVNGTYHWFIYVPEVSGYIRYQYRIEDNAAPNPMVFLGNELSTTYVAYTNGVVDLSNYSYVSNAFFKNTLQRDYMQSNVYGKTVYLFGDSNMDNFNTSLRRNFQKRFGCTCTSFASYGATWADGTGTGNTIKNRNSAIGQFNLFLEQTTIDPSTYLFPNDSAFFFMMGTNSGNVAGSIPEGGVGAITDETCENDVSAMNYVLKRMRYYGRNHPLGVFLPWACGGEKRENLIKICEYYKIPMFDIPAMIPEYTHTAGLVRPDGTTVTNDYFTDGGVHLSEYGWEKFRRIAEFWMAYQV